MMTRTPDEIKKGLKLCSVGFYENSCTDCPYSSLAMAECPTKLKTDALALIQQLQDDNAQLNRCIENMTDKLNAMNDEAAKLQAERDAAVKDMKNSRDCQCCKHYDVRWDEPCVHCDHDNNCFEWRGAQKEE